MVSSAKNQDLKINAIAGYKSDIIFLSDTRLNGRDVTVTEKLTLLYKMYHNSTKNSRGTAILISNRLDHEILDMVKDNDENILLIKVRINGVELGIGSIYGPNDNACDGFFSTIKDTVRSWNGIPCILGGDWNATGSYEDLNFNPDVLFMRSIPSRYRSEQVELLCEELDLADPFRALHPDLRDFTYYPSGTVRKNRSRIDFFLVWTPLFGIIESCTIAQGYCRRSFDHKPIFLSLKRRRGKGRICIYDSVINHPLANDTVRSSSYLTTINAGMVGAGVATEQILTSEKNKVTDIRTKINLICCLQGDSAVRELTEEEVQELNTLITSIPADWAQVAPLDYLSTFVRQVPADQYFENLVDNTRLDMINLQMHIKTVESAQRKAWARELAGLKRENYEVNIDRIMLLEENLNVASEKYVADRLSNYIKHDTLNSEKMTPHFLRIAEKNVEVNMSVIRDEQGNAFVRQQDRDEYITSFYEKLYKNPAGMPNDFGNCVEDFLGDLVNHPVIRGCKLTEDETMRLERPVTVEELDESLRSCNTN
jgi:exonuclease III